MTLAQLISRLEEYRETYGDHLEVRLMTQENWPFENKITGVTSSNEINTVDDEDDEDDDSNEKAVIYIVEGNQLGYGNKDAWKACY